MVDGSDGPDSLPHLHLHLLPHDFVLPFTKETWPISPPREIGFVTNRMRWKWRSARSETRYPRVHVFACSPLCLKCCCERHLWVGWMVLKLRMSDAESSVTNWGQSTAFNSQSPRHEQVQSRLAGPQSCPRYVSNQYLPTSDALRVPWLTVIQH